MQPGSDLLTAIAAWVTAAAGAITVMLFCGTLLLRLTTVLRARRRRAVVDTWRTTFATAMLSPDEARNCALARRRARGDRYLLEEWIRAVSLVVGDSALNLVTLANRLGLERVARKRLHRRDLHARLLAIQALGLLGDRHEWDTLMALAHDPNTALSATAALALVEIDVLNALPDIMAAIIERADWPPAPVYRILKSAGPALITQPLCHAILTSNAATAVRLLRYVDLAQTERIDQLIELVLRERSEPAVLAAALRASDSEVGAPRVAALAGHEDSYVRVQAARLLGRVGSRRDLPLLERLLADGEWWVRYRAAQSIVQLPFIGPNGLRNIQARQNDRYARDMMQQAMAEVGLA